MEEEKEELSLLDLISYYETGPVLKERPNDVLRTPSHPEELDFNYADDGEAQGKSLTRKAKLAKMQKKALGLTDVPGGSPPGAQGYRPRSSYEQQDFQTSHTTGFGGPSVIDVDEDKPPANINRRQRKKPINISFKTETDNFFSFLETGRLRRRRKRVGATMNKEQRELTKLAKALRLSGYNEQANAIMKLADYTDRAQHTFTPGSGTTVPTDWINAVDSAKGLIAVFCTDSDDGKSCAGQKGAEGLFSGYKAHLLSGMKAKIEVEVAKANSPITALTTSEIDSIIAKTTEAWKDLTLATATGNMVKNLYATAWSDALGAAHSLKDNYADGGNTYANLAASVTQFQDIKKYEKQGNAGTTPGTTPGTTTGGSTRNEGRMTDYTDGYIKDRETGNAFRDWVHSSGNLDAVNAQIVADNSRRTDGLDKGSASASWSNGYMWSAWKAVGEKYKRSRTGRENRPEREGEEQRGGSLSPGSEDQELPLKAYLQAPMGRTLAGDEVHNLPLTERNRLLRAVGSVGRTRRDGEDPPIVPADDGLSDTLLSDQFRAHVEDAYFKDAADDPYYSIKLKRLMRDGGGRRNRRSQLAGATTGDGEINVNDYIVAGDIYFKKTDASVWFKTKYPAANAKEQLPDNDYTLAPIESRDGWPGTTAPNNVGYLTKDEREGIINAIKAAFPNSFSEAHGSGGQALENYFAGQQQATRGGIFNTDNYRAKGVRKRDEARRALQGILTPLLEQANPAGDLRGSIANAAANDHVLASIGNAARKRRINALRKNSI
jgi:hypothetical protein